MPKYEDVIGHFMSNSPDGQPQAPEVPGATMRPSSPAGPNPPSVNGGPPGRPADPPMRGQSVGRNTRDPETVEQQKQPGGAEQLTRLFKGMPTRAEMLDLPPGVKAETPWGPVDDNGEIAFTPEGEQKYNEELVKAKQKFGPNPVAGMPGAPEMDAKLGAQFINPFTGQWGRY